MAKFKTAFYAYPSRPARLGETIEAAAKIVNDGHQSRHVRIRTWSQISIAGKVVIDQVLRAISDAELFACDLTYPNPNVLFELGYAIGKLKRIWISLDGAVTTYRETFRQLTSTLIPAGYITYSNRNHLAEQFHSTKPWTDLDENLLGSGFDPRGNRSPQPALYYLKQPFDSDESLALTRMLEASMFSEQLLVDDPKENPSPSLNWCAEKIRDADAVVVHLLSPDHDGNLYHNLRCAFTAGLGYAMHEKNVLMLAPSPYEAPLDYRGLLRVHDTATECGNIVANWLSEVEPRLPKKRPRQATATSYNKPELELADLHIGEPVAEHEEGSLETYFIQTGAYLTALDAEQALFVGRRGTGKTANFYELAREFARTPSTHVCTIKPLGYEIDGIIRLLQQVMHRAERGYLLESLWKLLIYTELVASVANLIRNRRPDEAHLLTDGERELLNFVDAHSDLVDPPFSLRIERAIAPLLTLGDETDTSQQNLKISEYLHVALVPQIRAVLGNALADRRRVAILIDNLDEPWVPGADVEHLANLLLALMRVARDIGQDFRQAKYWKKPINTNIVVFIRSDIYQYVHRLAPEPDKLPIHLLYWDDRDLLLRVIDERLQSATFGRLSADEIWRTMFTDSVNGMHPRDFATAYTLPRPRHLIYLVRDAITKAVSRQHRVVTEVDLFDARRSYSEYAFWAILSEDDRQRGKLESILYEFAGASPILLRTQVESIIRAAGVDDDGVAFYVNLLCDLNFLGIESADGFRYARHEAERRLLREVAARAAARTQGPELQERYEVNRAFDDVLGIRR